MSYNFLMGKNCQSELNMVLLIFLTTLSSKLKKIFLLFENSHKFFFTFILIISQVIQLNTSETR